MGTELERVSQILESSLDANQIKRKEAELALKAEERKPGFSVILLQLVATSAYSNTIRLASALCFKNFLKRCWVDDDGNHMLPPDEVLAIKQEIIGLMISVPPNIQSQLGDAIGIIAQSDFYEKWDTLVDDLVSRLTPDNITVNNGVLQVAHSIFKRWRPLYRSDALFTEILHVLGKFGPAFLAVFENTDRLIEQNRSNKPLLKESLSSLNLIIKLFYDLSCQDLAPIFEDNLRTIVTLLEKYLLFNGAELLSDSDEEAGPLEFVKSGIFQVLSLYVQKYNDAFGEYVATFVTTSWNLLNTTGSETKNDILVSKALHFLTTATSIQQHAETFNQESHMSQVVEKVILPNITLRDSDVEQFEDEPLEFIRRDLEGSDSDTRRRSAVDLLRGLMAKFEKLVTDVVLKYVNHFLTQYAADPKSWKSKDTAVYLYSAIAAKTALTSREGVKTINPHVNVIEFFTEHIAKDLMSAEGHPLLQVDAIKFLYTFRSQMSAEQWQAAFPLLVHHLGTPNFVVYSYAAIAVERVLALTDENRVPVVGRAVVRPLASDLLQRLFRLIEKDKHAERSLAAIKIQENEFLMRCVMRVLVVIREDVSSLASTLLPHFVDITGIISLNPSNPRFCYYHFEALGAIIRFAGASDSANVAKLLFPPFLAIMQNDIQDFMPYVIQLFAALLESNPTTALPEFYKSLIPSITAADLWLMGGNVPALTRLLSSMISRGAAEFTLTNQLVPVLGIFQRLILIKKQEAYAFELLDAIFTSFAPAALEQYHTAILQTLLTKLQNNKTDAFTSRFVRFYHFISANGDHGLGTDFFIKIVEQIQANMFVPLYLNIILPDTAKLVRSLDRKTAVISFTKTLTESAAFANQYKKGWAYTCEALLSLLVNPPAVTASDDTIVENDVDDMTFGVGFTQLTTIKKPFHDPWLQITNIKSWVGEYLKAADARQGGKIGGFVRERLSPEKQQELVAYMSA